MLLLDPKWKEKHIKFLEKINVEKGFIEDIYSSLRYKKLIRKGKVEKKQQKLICLIFILGLVGQEGQLTMTLSLDGISTGVWPLFAVCNVFLLVFPHFYFPNFSFQNFYFADFYFSRFFRCLF